MNEIASLTINWNRSILIDTIIDDTLVKKLTPTILALRQENSDPITIGIDSHGGSLASLDTLLQLLTGPDQNGVKCKVITVTTNRAYSAAANFLAFGTYAVALPHSQILYHDVRVGGLEDVTPEKARNAAKSLQEANDSFALKLAHRIIKRLIWIYISLEKDFEKINAQNSGRHNSYKKQIEFYAPKTEGYEGIDLASFVTALWAKLSPENDMLINSVMMKLSKWIHLTKIAHITPTYKEKGSRTPGLLDGTNHLFKLFKGDQKNFTATEENLKLLLCLFAEDISDDNFESVNFTVIIDRVVREFGILNSMNDSRHIKYAIDLMFEHAHVFFDSKFNAEIDAIPEDQRNTLFRLAEPHARLFWHFCVLLCRELFEGEHIINPMDAQLLGIVDEVAGGGHIQSKREYHIKRAKSE